MENMLLKVMAESFERKQAGDPRLLGNLPFITISREFGCQANLLAAMLKQELDKSGKTWQIMNKEIIQDAARELHLDTDLISRISGSFERTQMDEIIHALSSRYYKSDRKIRQTIASVVLNTAHAGHVIVVGRGGAVVTRGLHPSIHVHLIAPIEWRLNSLMVRYGLKREETYKQLTETDHKRYKLIRDSLKGAEAMEHLFDLSINCNLVSHEEMVKIIMNLAQIRKMV
ncbi:MAG: cytidylate kinase-like family protein [Bacteroidales bacterium]|nr:cytidylate kinase-like family protein [Bacteroidales bacterium]